MPTSSCGRALRTLSICRLGLAPPTMGAEDFSYMLQKRPGAYLWLCGDSEYALHHPKYVFDDAVLPLGAAWFVRLAQRALPAV